MEINNNTMEVIKARSRFGSVKFWLGLAVLAILIVGALLCNKIWFKMNTSGYQSVFLTNGQVYFGKLTTSGRFYKLTDVYYLQVTQPLQQTENAPSTNNSNVQLVKLGSELHGPKDEMFIEKDKVLFWENMKDDAKVLDAINQHKNK